MHTALMTTLTSPAIVQQPVRSAFRRRCCSSRRTVQCAATPGGLPPVTDREGQPAVITKPVQKRSVGARLNDTVKQQWDRLMAEVMPEERGDARDWALMYASVAVFVFMAMQMFRVYAHWYYAAGLRPIMQTFH